MAHPLPGGRAVVLRRSVAETAASLDREHPGDGQKWERFVGPYLKGFDAVSEMMLGGFPPVTGTLQLLRDGGPLPVAGFGLLAAGSARALARRLFGGGGCRAWLYGAAAHGDAPITSPGSALAAFYLNLLGHAVGWPSPRGGAGRLSDALVSYLRSLGATVRTSARVDRILVVAGRVRGVRIAGGEEVPASLVLADLMPHALAAMAGDELASWYRGLLRRFRYGPATVKVDWALDGTIPWSAPEARTAGTVHVGGDEDSTSQSLAASERGVPDRPFLLLGQQSVADPTRAPDGKHTAWAYTHAPASAAAQFGSERTVQAIEEQVELFAPGFRERILARHVLRPGDLEARNPNLVHGDVGGGSYRGLQAVFRPFPTVSPYRTPAHGLFLASAAAFPGGAVHGVPGDAAARAALRTIGVRG